MRFHTDKKFSPEKTSEETIKDSLEIFGNGITDFDLLAESISQGLAYCSMVYDENNQPVDFKILKVNREFEEYMNLKKELCIGKTVLEIFPNTQELCIENCARVAKTLQTEIITGYNPRTNRNYRNLVYSNKPGEFIVLFGGTTKQEGEQQATQSSQTVPAATEKPLILIAEDEETNYLLLESWLKLNFRLLHGLDGEETVTLHQENKDIQLILMDIKMPYLNGIEATRAIRKIDSEIPIIAQTAFITEDDRKEILEAGCNEILSKPIRRKEFEIILQKYLGGA